MALQVGARIAIALGGEQHEWPVGQAAADEAERGTRRAIEPVQVVDDQRQGAFTGQQIEERESDEQRLARRLVAQPERGAEHAAVQRLERVDPPQQRSQQAVQTGERQSGLDLHPRRGRHGQRARARVAARRVEQPRLADAGLSAEQHGGAAAGRGGVDRAAQDRQLLVASDEIHGCAGSTPLSWEREVIPSLGKAR